MRLRKAFAGFALVSGASFVFAFACSSFNGDSPDVDSGVPDVVTADVVVIDGDRPTDAGNQPFCDAHRDAKFCFSFENGDPNEPRQPADSDAMVVIADPNSPSLDTSLSRSPPNSLFVDVMHAGASDYKGAPRAGVRLVLPNDPGQHVRCDFALLVDQADENVQSDAANVDLIFGILTSQADAGLPYDLSLRMAADRSFFMQAGNNTYGHQPAGAVPAKQWVDAHIFFDAEPGAVKLHAKLGTHADGNVVPLPIAGNQIGALDMMFGASFVTGHWIVRLDDIACYWN